MLDIENLEHQTYRAASLAGLFYPDEGILVQSVLQSFGLIQNPRINTHCVFLPHGSWHVMGNPLSLAYNSLINRDENPKSKGLISRVVMLGRRHHADDAGIFLSESDYFETPIGDLKIDKKINESLLSCNTLFELNDIPHLQEDINESHFPFVKYMFPEASFIPVLIGGFEQKTMTSLAKALKVVFEPILDDTLFVVVSNSSNHADAQIAKTQSEKFISLVREKNGAELLRNFHEGSISACGSLAMAALLESGLLENTAMSQIFKANGSLLDVDNKTVYYSALNFPKKPDSLEPFVERRNREDRRLNDRRNND
ncbi:MAG: AmmeMemoRadiSam system protein B [Treponema sp.]|jgi:AmmeMemoRadiSam system protein B|nr:AmmeMemoRadiSam system protein B [Treponema sp.]